MILSKCNVIILLSIIFYRYSVSSSQQRQWILEQVTRTLYIDRKSALYMYMSHIITVNRKYFVSKIFHTIINK